MGEGLYKRVQAILRTRGMSEDYLGKLMIDRGMQYRPVYMDSFATPDDIRVISGMLQVAPSILFEATPLVDELIGALFEEKWPQHESRTDLSKQEASRRVRQSEFRLNSSQSTIRNQVELALKALESPSGKVFGCEYPDCSCITRCAATGCLIGLEG